MYWSYHKSKNGWQGLLTWGVVNVVYPDNGVIALFPAKWKFISRTISERIGLCVTEKSSKTFVILLCKYSYLGPVFVHCLTSVSSMILVHRHHLQNKGIHWYLCMTAELMDEWGQQDSWINILIQVRQNNNRFIPRHIHVLLTSEYFIFVCKFSEKNTCNADDSCPMS